MAARKERVNPESSGVDTSYAVEYRGRLLEALSPLRVVANEGEDCSVTVGVRVRPFSEREKRLGAKVAVQVNGNETSIMASGGVVHRFLYDYSFWSCDSHMTTFASQEVVYKSLAQPLLDWSFEGYNTCIFAYGQTGSGKSYSIMGEGSEVGIVPRFSQELFDRVEGNMSQLITYKVEISYYEVYNERIHDLLASNRRKSKMQLRVREHPVLGPYVEDLSTYVVTSFADIEHWLSIGNKFRATAATGMNDKSSRSHSVFIIMLTQTGEEEGEEMSKVSRINLIDLAGSERSAVAMTSGERLKEGGSINRSLHTLGKVIALLAERSSGKRKKVYIPYRDSTLTWLLKDSLGGNSKTAMIATISPADIHYDESLSTLRYAHQARSIVNIARINEDPTSRLIRELRTEIDQLRSQLQGQPSSMSVLMDTSSSVEVLSLKKQLQESEKLVAEATRTWKERLDQAEKRKQEEVDKLKRAGVAFKVDNRLPNLVNLNEDPQLSEMLLYIIKEGTTVIGQKSPSSEHEIQLTGALVAMNHCVITNVAGTVSISPSDDSAQTFVNGDLIMASTVLHHGDRVVVGGDHYFRFNHPTEVAERGIKKSTSNTSMKDFEFARNELIEAQRSKLEAEVEQARQKEREKMMDELQQVKRALDSEKASYSTQMEELELELRRRAEMNEEKDQTKREAESKVHQLEEKNKQLEEETALQRQVIHLEKLRAQKEQEELHSYRARVLAELEEEKKRLESHIAEIQEGRGESDSTTDLDTSLKDERFLRGSELLHISMMVQEANSISKTLGKNITFLRDYSQSAATESEIGFRVTDAKKGVSVFWDLPKLEERLEQMRELYQAYLDGDSPTPSCAEDDPFYNPFDGWEEAEGKITSSGIALLRKFPHLQVPTHIRDQLIAMVSPSGSPVLKPSQGRIGDSPGLAGVNPPSFKGQVQNGSGLAAYWREKLAESSSRPISPLLTTTSSPFQRNDTPSSDISRLEDGLEPPPPVAKLCLSRIAALAEEVKGLRHRQCRNIMVAVLRNIAKLSTAVAVLAETADSYFKLSKSGEVQVALHETTDIESCCLSISSSLELLVQSVSHLQLEQDYLQHALSHFTSDHAGEGRAAAATEKVLERLMDRREEVMERVVQMLQVVCSGDEAAIFSTQDTFSLSMEHLGQLVGSLSLARKLLAGPGKEESLPYCIKDDELWSEGLPYSTVKSYFCGVMVFCQEQLTQVAYSMQHKEGGGVLSDDESEVVKSATKLSEAVATFLEALAAHQTSLWEDLLHHVDDGTLPNLPQCSSLLEVIHKMADIEESILALKESSKDNLTSLSHSISRITDSFTQLAAASLSMVRSAQCSAEVLITADLQALSRDTLKACKTLRVAMKAMVQAEEANGQGQHQQLAKEKPPRQSIQELLNDSTSGFAV